jgi:hypothetical protein
MKKVYDSLGPRGRKLVIDDGSDLFKLHSLYASRICSEAANHDRAEMVIKTMLKKKGKYDKAVWKRLFWLLHKPQCIVASDQ